MTTIPLPLAKADDLRALGIEPAAAAELHDRAVLLLDGYRRFARSLSVMLESCTGCGACARACHSYLGTEDDRNTPSARSKLLGEAYRRHASLPGRLLATLPGRRVLDRETLDAWIDAFYQCNACRRCAAACPLGIDTGEVTLAGRHILAELGLVSEFIAEIGKNELETGNNRGLSEPALRDSCAFLEQELKAETGLDIRIPIDEPGAEILYVPSSSDFFTNSATTMGAAKLFHRLGARWTLSSTILEAANYGLWFHLGLLKEHNRRLRAAAAALRTRQVVMGECGHGWRVAKMYSEGANGAVPFRLRHVLEYAAAHLDALRFAKLPMRATLHDPCNYARSAGLTEPPRQLMRACVEEFVEMAPNREGNFCCGGGAGMLMDEMAEIRVLLGKKKAEQMKALEPLDYVALPCASCKAQVPLLLERYGMKGIRSGGVLDLVGKAIRL